MGWKGGIGVMLSMIIVENIELYGVVKKRIERHNDLKK